MPIAAARRFYLERTDETAGIVADGCTFPDGTTVLRWRGVDRSTALYDSPRTVESVHGSDGTVDITWID